MRRCYFEDSIVTRQWLQFIILVSPRFLDSQVALNYLLHTYSWHGTLRKSILQTIDSICSLPLASVDNKWKTKLALQAINTVTTSPSINQCDIFIRLECTQSYSCVKSEYNKYMSCLILHFYSNVNLDSNIISII